MSVPELPAGLEEVLASTIDSSMFELYKPGRQPVMPEQCRTAASRVWCLLYTWIVNNGGAVQLPADPDAPACSAEDPCGWCRKNSEPPR